MRKIKYLSDYYLIDLYRVARYLPDKNDPYIKDNAADWDTLNKKYSRYFSGEETVIPLEIRTVSEESGMGVFTDSSIQEGQFIRLYTGKIRPIRRLFPLNHDYCLEYPPMKGGEIRFEIDALKEGNESRFFNHDFDGNLILEHSFYQRQWYVFFIADRDISAGEQLCFNYGEEYWAVSGKEIEFYT